MVVAEGSHDDKSVVATTVVAAAIGVRESLAIFFSWLLSGSVQSTNDSRSVV